MDALRELRLPKLEKACCGVTLEKGSMAVAIFYIFVITGLFLFDFVAMTIIQYKSNVHYAYYEDFEHVFMRDEFTFTMVVCTFVFSLALLHGIRKRDTTYMEPWLIMKATLYCMNILFLILMIVEILQTRKDIIIFFTLTYIALDSYFITVVYSLYSKLRNHTQTN